MRARDPRVPLPALAGLFLRLGCTAFGGPAAHVALMREEVVKRRRWLSDREFLDLLGASSLIPGPTSTELTMHLGRRLAGWRGLGLAGAAFITPAALLTLGFAWAYVRYGSLPAAGGALAGVKPVIIAIVLVAIVGLARAALRRPVLWATAGAAAVASMAGLGPLPILLLGGLAGQVGRRVRTAVVAGPALTMAATVPAVAAATGGAILGYFLKLGAVLFGSGYVLLAFLRHDLVVARGWLTETQLLDAVAAGQFTPGPVFTTATFVGYLVGGAQGAGLATVGIFLPGFAYVVLTGPLVPRLRRDPFAARVLDGVNAATIGLMAVVTWELGRAAVTGWAAAVIGLVALALLLKRVLNPAWLVLAGALLGWLCFG